MTVALTIHGYLRQPGVREAAISALLGASLPKNQPAAADLAAEMPQVASRNAADRSQCWNWGGIQR
jgi:hypothetical protein